MQEKLPFHFGVQETVLLVNHALARGTPTIFVIFVVSRGSSSKALVLLVRMQIRHFHHFRQKPPFSGGTKARFTKSTVFGTLITLRAPFTTSDSVVRIKMLRGWGQRKSFQEPREGAFIREAHDTFNFLRHIMRAIWSV